MMRKGWMKAEGIERGEREKVRTSVLNPPSQKIQSATLALSMTSVLRNWTFSSPAAKERTRLSEPDHEPL